MSEKQYIKRDAVLDYIRNRAPIPANAVGAVYVDIKAISAAPVREVVTCGECIHLGIKDFATGYCKGGPMCGVVKPWDYCSHGVRKADMRAEEGGAT